MTDILLVDDEAGDYGPDEDSSGEERVTRLLRQNPVPSAWRS